MKVQIDLPDRVWGRLALEADRREVKLADMVADAIKGLTRPEPAPKRPRKPRTPSDPDRNPYADRQPLRGERERALILDLRARGWSLPEIAKRLDVGAPRIGATLWDLGVGTKRINTKERK